MVQHFDFNTTMKGKNFLKNLVFLDETLIYKRVFKSFILFMLTMFLISKSFWLESEETQLNYLLDPLYNCLIAIIIFLIKESISKNSTNFDDLAPNGFMLFFDCLLFEYYRK